MAKIVVLNSGGFDSTVLAHKAVFDAGSDVVHSLHFLYGARNEKQQLACVEKVCHKLGMTSKVIQLPKFDWTSGRFYSDWYDYETQYLEYRNLVFISYAMSYAQSIGADRILMAVYGDRSYSDTNDNFMNKVKELAELSGISIETPFDFAQDKTDLLQTAIQFGVRVGDFFSCDVPKKDGNPCGECFDCKGVEAIERVIQIDTPHKALYQNSFNYESREFLEQMKVIPADREVRALINNDCQLECKHCFYGFSDMVRSALSKEQYFETLRVLVTEKGFNHIHFSGKEPLYNDDILYFAERLAKEVPQCSFDVVTNGINLPKYAHNLKVFGAKRVCLSVDITKEGSVRNITNDEVYLKAIQSTQREGIDLTVFIDVCKFNVGKVDDKVKELICLGVKDFYIRTVRTLGNAEESIKANVNDLWGLILRLENLSTENEDVKIGLSISSEYTEDILNHGEFSDRLEHMDSLYTIWWLKNFWIYLESYCDRYKDITLTPDGYILGCASEVSRKDYDKIAAGNVYDEELDSILDRGWDMRYSCASRFKEGNCSCMANKL